jgi:hypothetical protein
MNNKTARLDSGKCKNANTNANIRKQRANKK